MESDWQDACKQQQKNHSLFDVFISIVKVSSSQITTFSILMFLLSFYYMYVCFLFVETVFHMIIFKELKGAFMVLIKRGD